MNSIELNTLVGEHILTGVDHEQVRIVDAGGYDYEDATMLRFVLDGQIYVATEDPNDGYRSSLRSLLIVDGPPVANMFAPVRVFVREAGSDREYVNDYLEFIDANNGKTILEVGTDNADDYYPSFVGRFWPERMAVNAAIEK